MTTDDLILQTLHNSTLANVITVREYKPDESIIQPGSASSNH